MQDGNTGRIDSQLQSPIQSTNCRVCLSTPRNIRTKSVLTGGKGWLQIRCPMEHHFGRKESPGIFTSYGRRVSRIPRAYPSQYSVLALASTLGFGTSFSVKLSAISSLDLFSFLSTASLLSTLGSFTRLARLSTVSTFSLLTFLHTSPLTKIGLIDHTALQKQIHVIL